MKKVLTAVISFLVPVAGIGIFFFKLYKKDRPAAFFALLWSMIGLAAAFTLFLWKGSQLM